VSPDLVEYGTSWSPRCRAITVTWVEISVRAEGRDGMDRNIGETHSPLPGTLCQPGLQIRSP
jgi:hypothetical protein